MRNNNTLTVVNTNKRDVSENQNRPIVITRSSVGRGSSPQSNATQITNTIAPIVGENYADIIRELKESNFLYNPSFANGAEGWSFSESDFTQKKVRIIPVDYKMRLILRDGGSVTQPNSLIKKPKKHYIYNYNKDRQDIEYKNEDVGSPSEGITIKDINWENLPDFEKTKDKTEKDDCLYLSISFKCNDSGSIEFGFNGTDNSKENVLKYTSQNMSASEDIQAIQLEGVWDGTGDFIISVPEGEIEIVSLSLTDKPLENYIEQNESAISQILENIQKASEYFSLLKNRFTLVQTELLQLYSNDSAIKTTLEDHEKRINKLELDYESLHSSINKINTSISDIKTDISNLEKRIEAIENPPTE